MLEVPGYEVEWVDLKLYRGSTIPDNLLHPTFGRMVIRWPEPSQPNLLKALELSQNQKTIQDMLEEDPLAFEPYGYATYWSHHDMNLSSNVDSSGYHVLKSTGLRSDEGIVLEEIRDEKNLTYIDLEGHRTQVARYTQIKKPTNLLNKVI